MTASPAEADAFLGESPHPPDVALVDLAAEGGNNGVMYADHLVARYPRLRVIFMTGARREEEPLVVAVHARGQLLQKPFTSQQLLDVVQMAV